MSSEHPEEFSQTSATTPQLASDASRRNDASRDSETAGDHRPANEGANQEATVLVRGETLRNSEQSAPKAKEKAPPKQVSDAKTKMQSRLPVLDDDSDVGVEKPQIVIRDGKADLAFTGTLLASAAPSSARKGQWHEYRIYETNGGKHVFSKVTRSIYVEEQDAYEADVFDPAPTSVPSQLLRSARDLTRSHPMTWMDAAVAFFGYDPLAKTLYRKLSGQFEEHIN